MKLKSKKLGIRREINLVNCFFFSIELSAGLLKKRFDFISLRVLDSFS